MGLLYGRAGRSTTQNGGFRRGQGQNASAMLGRKCVLQNGPTATLEKCLIASVIAADIETPLFGWQSQFDHDQRGCEMTPACAASASCINEYGRNLSSTIRSQLLATSDRNGAFVDSCTRHCWPGSMGQLALQANGSTPLQALAKWYAGSAQREWSQGATFPCTQCCR
jgi:hypothetical protein